MKKIIGIMAIKNAISQGYPFLEAIYSFLKWGDELYLGDDSNDGTETILDTIKLSNKIKLFKIKWPSDSKLIAKGGVIAHVHNELLKNVKLHNKDAMVFYLQANEITHEDSYEELRNLYNLYPNYIGYLLPYQVFVGPYMIQDSTWRVRYASTKYNLRILGDGTHMEITGELSFSSFIKEYAYELYRYISLKEYYFRNFRRFNKYYKLAYLPKPIFRYGVMFPKNIFSKMEGHAKVYTGVNLYKDLGTASSWQGYLYDLSKNKKYNDINKFYKRASKRMCEYNNKSTQKTGWASEPKLVKDHPKIMRDLLDQQEYKSREGIIKKIINL